MPIIYYLEVTRMTIETELYLSIVIFSRYSLFHCLFAASPKISSTVCSLLSKALRLPLFTFLAIPEAQIAADMFCSHGRGAVIGDDGGSRLKLFCSLFASIFAFGLSYTIHSAIFSITTASFQHLSMLYSCYFSTATVTRPLPLLSSKYIASPPCDAFGTLRCHLLH